MAPHQKGGRSAKCLRRTKAARAHHDNARLQHHSCPLMQCEPMRSSENHALNPTQHKFDGECHFVPSNAAFAVPNIARAHRGALRVDGLEPPAAGRGVVAHGIPPNHRPALAPYGQEPDLKRRGARAAKMAERRLGNASPVTSLDVVNCNNWHSAGMSVA
eukprot:CAMPEP_0170352576 /NCGR_PEP_ID=MMETSP0116_2-20130129/77600_1 /TAXON_ID=400756 /ORGANISM="Durinskia baltica, Strain CSIRO CS-38" /LENGTH=159 /DNA_ID=CAMNT_0010606503 /DNA_START=72 /DNA_END=552 /DNA_ORIENTATION=+